MQQFLAFVSTGRTGVDVEHKANGCRHQLVLPWCQEQVARKCWLYCLPWKKLDLPAPLAPTTRKGCTLNTSSECGVLTPHFSVTYLLH